MLQLTIATVLTALFLSARVVSKSFEIQDTGTAVESSSTQISDVCGSPGDVWIALPSSYFASGSQWCDQTAVVSSDNNQISTTVGAECTSCAEHEIALSFDAFRALIASELSHLATEVQAQWTIG